jgi:hypothetical protein
MSDLFDEISCDLPRVFSEAAKEGHDASQRLARQLQARLWMARQRHIAPMADQVRLVRSLLIPDAWQEVTPEQFDRCHFVQAISMRLCHLHRSEPL